MLLWPNYFPKALPDNITLRVRFQHRNFGRTQTFSLWHTELLCARWSAKHFKCIISFNLYHNLKKYVLLLVLRNSETKRFNNLPRFPPIIRMEVGFTCSCSSCSLHEPHLEVHKCWLILGLTWLFHLNRGKFYLSIYFKRKKKLCFNTNYIKKRTTNLRPQPIQFAGKSIALNI